MKHACSFPLQVYYADQDVSGALRELEVPATHQRHNFALEMNK